MSIYSDLLSYIYYYKTIKTKFENLFCVLGLECDWSFKDHGSFKFVHS